MDETRYHTIVDATLLHCYDQLEPAFDSGAIDDLDLHDGILTIVTLSNTTLIINKHTASRQIWLASPRLGGLHFSYDAIHQQWHLPDGTLFYDLLRRELATHSIEVIL